MAFDLSNYVPVQDRIDLFWKDHPRDGTAAITTDLIDVRDDGAIMFRATLTVAGGIVATGYAEERRTPSGVNSTSAVENCETSAIGRALANYGYMTNAEKSRASRAEMSKVNRDEARRNALREAQKWAAVDIVAAIDADAERMGRAPGDVTERFRERRGDGLTHAELADTVPVPDLAALYADIHSWVEVPA